MVWVTNSVSSFLRESVFGPFGPAKSGPEGPSFHPLPPSSGGCVRRQ